MIYSVISVKSLTICGCHHVMHKFTWTWFDSEGDQTSVGAEGHDSRKKRKSNASTYFPWNYQRSFSEFYIHECAITSFQWSDQCRSWLFSNPQFSWCVIIRLCVCVCSCVHLSAPKVAALAQLCSTESARRSQRTGLLKTLFTQGDLFKVTEQRKVSLQVLYVRVCICVCVCCSLYLAVACVYVLRAKTVQMSDCCFIVLSQKARLISLFHFSWIFLLSSSVTVKELPSKNTGLCVHKFS